MTSNFAKSRDNFFNNYISKNNLNVNYLKKKIKSRIVFFYPKAIDEKISKRSLNYIDYIIILITSLYMIFKILFINKTKLFIKKYT